MQELISQPSESKLLKIAWIEIFSVYQVTSIRLTQTFFWLVTQTRDPPRDEACMHGRLPSDWPAARVRVMLISLFKGVSRSPSEFHTGRVLPKMACTWRLLPKGEPSSGRHQVYERDKILLVDDERVKESKSGISVWKKAQEGLQDVFYNCEKVEEPGRKCSGFVTYSSYFNWQVGESGKICQ